MILLGNQALTRFNQTFISPQIFVMSYDFHGSWERKVAHHSPLYAEPGQNPEFCTDFAVNYWIQKGAPPSKVNSITNSFLVTK